MSQEHPSGKPLPSGRGAVTDTAEAKTGERTALIEALKDTLRMLEAAYWQLGMNVRNNPRIVKARSALEAAMKTEGQKT